MTVDPRGSESAGWREARRATLGRSSRFAGARTLLIGVGIAVAVMLAVALLDYRLNQPVHRVAKLLLAAALGAGVLLKPWVGLFCFPVVVPFLGWIPPVPIPGVNTLNLLLGGVFVTWAIGRAMAHESIFRPARLGLSMVLILVVAALSIVRGGAFPTGYTYDALEASIDLFRAIVTFCVYFVVLAMARGPRARKAMAWAIVLGVLAEGVTTAIYGRSGKGARAVGSIGQANELGTYLALYAVFAAALLTGVRNFFGKLALLASVLVASYATVLSVSRAALIALALGLTYVGIRSSRLMTALLVIAAISSPLWAPDYLKDRLLGTHKVVEGTDEAEVEHGAQQRVDTWRAIGSLIMDHPVDGVGFNGLKYVLPETGEDLGLDVKDSAHNTYMRTLGEMGIFGLMLFCWLLWQCWRLGNDAARAARNAFDRQIGVGVAAATLGLALSCAFGDRFFNPIITGGFWIACALANDILLEREEAAA
jgi:hypothetical protein